MQKFLGWVGLLAILVALGGIYEGYIKYSMWKGGFEIRSEYDAASEQGINTKTEYDSFLVAEAERRKNSCVFNWQACKDNAELVDKYEKFSEIQWDCKVRATSLAKYGVIWGPTWFTTYNVGNDYVPEGMVVLFEYGARLKNVFGGDKSAALKCFYDLEDSSVVTITEM